MFLERILENSQTKRVSDFTICRSFTTSILTNKVNLCYTIISVLSIDFLRLHIYYIDRGSQLT
jgi:hypothetical protein